PRAHDRPDLVGGLWLGVAEVGRAKERRRAARLRLDETLRRVQLKVYEAARDLAEVRVREGMVADVVPFGDDAPHQLGVLLSILADDEDARGHALLFEVVEDARSPDGIGVSAKGQR